MNDSELSAHEHVSFSGKCREMFCDRLCEMVSHSRESAWGLGCPAGMISDAAMAQANLPGFWRAHGECACSARNSMVGRRKFGAAMAQANLPGFW